SRTDFRQDMHPKTCFWLGCRASWSGNVGPRAEPASEELWSMQVKETVSLAKQYVKDVFADEQIDSLSLEEVEFDDKAGIWAVTIGFSRPWDEAGPLGVKLGVLAPRRRDYKVVRIVDGDKRVISV